VIVKVRPYRFRAMRGSSGDEARLDLHLRSALECGVDGVDQVERRLVLAHLRHALSLDAK